MMMMKKRLRVCMSVLGHLVRPPLKVAAAFAVGLGVAAGVSAATAATAATGPTNNGSPTVSGTAQEGQTLTATTGSWTSTATPPTISYSFKWQRCNTSGGSCGDISGAVSQTYQVTSTDLNSTLRVVVSATDGTGTNTAYSPTTDVVTTPGSKPTMTSSQPTPQGTPRVGQTLTISQGNWTGTGTISFSYQWQRCRSGGCTNISGATGSSYKATNSDLGYGLRALITGSNSFGSTQVSSNVSATVVADVAAPANKAKPTIGGSTSVGSTLTGSVGTWSGPQPITFSLSWERCDGAGNNCKAISGAGASTHVLTSADVNSTIRLVVKATNPGGSVTATSDHTAAVTTLPPGATRLPNGKTSIPVTSVSLPDRLVISTVKYTPNPVRSRSRFQARYLITDSNGYVVRGALVYALGIPYSWIGKATEVTSGTDGYAYVYITPTKKLPLANGRAMIVFVRARKPGGNVLAGVSTRRLTQVRLGKP
jgi:hypothetical protein